MGAFTEYFSKIICMHPRLVLWVQQSGAFFGGSVQTFMAICRSCSIDRIWPLIGIGFFLVLFSDLWEKALHSPFLRWSSASVHHSAGFASSQVLSTVTVWRKENVALLNCPQIPHLLFASLWVQSLQLSREKNPEKFSIKVDRRVIY